VSIHFAGHEGTSCWIVPQMVTAWEFVSVDCADGDKNELRVYLTGGHHVRVPARHAVKVSTALEAFHGAPIDRMGPPPNPGTV
jgi:hypothetical protein